MGMMMQMLAFLLQLLRLDLLVDLYVGRSAIAHTTGESVVHVDFLQVGLAQPTRLYFLA